MTIQGLRNTGVDGGTGLANDFQPDQRPLDWRSGVLLLYPNGRAPLTALTSQMKKEIATDPQFHWWDKKLKTQRYELAAEIVDTVQTDFVLGAGDAKEIRIGHVLLVEASGELVRVTATSADTTITVERGVAGSTKAAVDIAAAGINPNLLIIGSAYAEGSSKPTGINFDPTKQWNYTQIFRWNIGMTDTARQTRLRTGDQIREAKREALEYHAIEQEKAFWLGRKFETTDAVTGEPLRYTGGFQDFVDPNRDWSGSAKADISTGAGPDRVKDFGAAPTSGAVSMLVFEEWLKATFEYGSSEKMAFCGNRALLTVNQIVRMNSSYNIYNGESEYGMSVMRVTCPFGEIVLKTHPLWNQNPGGVAAGGGVYYGMDSWIAILDMANLTYRPLDGRDTKYIPKQEDPGQDGSESGYLTECGMEFAHPTTMSLARGFSVGAAD